MLKATHITKQYGDLGVLKGVDLEIKPKTIASIVGASGAGKSTLLHILGTLDSPDEGNVIIKDTDVTSLRGREIADFRNKNIGFVFQFHNLLPEFSAVENVCIPGFLSKRDSKQVKARAIELLELLGLSDRIHHKPSQLSGGEQQRTAVARALINSPSIVFADEPSGNLDSTNARELHNLFLELRDTIGQTFVIVTHNDELADMADQKFEMRDGLIISSTANTSVSIPSI